MNFVAVKSMHFSVRMVRLYHFLTVNKKEYILSKQALRSGTSIGANITEAENAFSKREFLAKMYIAFKESCETIYWLQLLHNTGYLTDNEFLSIYNDCVELRQLLSSITKTTRENLEKRTKTDLEEMESIPHS